MKKFLQTLIEPSSSGYLAQSTNVVLRRIGNITNITMSYFSLISKIFPDIAENVKGKNVTSLVVWLSLTTDGKDEI